MHNHILLEMYCLKDTDENKTKEKPKFCVSNNYKPQYNCIFYNCPFVSFTSCENTLCYVNQCSEVETSISLGGDNYTTKQISLWEQISQKKIDEAFEEFLNRTK